MTQHYPKVETSRENLANGDVLSESPEKNCETVVPLEFDATEKDNHSVVSSDVLPPCGGKVGHLLAKSRSWLKRQIFNENNEKALTWCRNGFLFLVAALYMTFVVIRWYKSDCQNLDWSQGRGFAFIIFTIVITCIVYSYLIQPGVDKISQKLTAAGSDFILHKIFQIGYYGILILIFALFMWTAIDSASNDWRRLISLGGYVSILLFGLIFSKHPEYIKWSTIFSGVALQMGIGLAVIKVEIGRNILQVVGTKAEEFLSFSYVGARFVYGDFLIDNFVFAFRTLSVLFFMVVIVNVLFYFGWLQSACYKLGSLMQVFLGTTIVESVNAVATVFLGMSESPLLFKPYLELLTPSEIHAIMSAGFATVAGTVLAAYTGFGAEPANIITASAMAAPAALAFSKLFYPEQRRSKTSSSSIKMVQSEDTSAIDAASKGAISAIELVQGIIAMLIACVSLVAFLNAIFNWLGLLAGIEGLSFESIVGKMFIPLAWIMGVVPSQCEDVARLIGIKTVINEFVAYKELGELKKLNRLSVRSEAIATFALCGFANPASVAIMIAVLSNLCPSQRPVITKVALRSFIAGSCTSFLSACLAGLLIPENGFPVTEIIYGPEHGENITSCSF